MEENQTENLGLIGLWRGLQGLGDLPEKYPTKHTRPTQLNRKSKIKNP